ncbi:MAG: sulfur carrier protein ThiS [Victivallaceae bacterium]|jgi:sulfur carrier protein
MNITVNGKVFIIEANLSLEQFLKDRGFDPARTVAAVNGSVAGSEDCGGIILKENDVLDVMSFVGGG